MATTYSDIANQIIGALRLSDPDLDTSVGTPTRKIIDAVSESISEAYVDQHLLSYQYDIDSKIGADLDDFVRLFGMARFPAKRASGVITFTRRNNTNAKNSVAVPINSQVISNTQPQAVAVLVSAAWLEPYALTVNVAAQMVEAGPAGNVPANSMINLGSPMAGIGSSTNVRAFTGGTHQETDAELRDRWKRTVFRNLAGTEQMYLGVALDDANCYTANVIGASKKRREQVQIVGGIGQCTVDDAASVYAEPVFVGRSIDGGKLAVKGVDYTWNNTWVDSGTGLLQPRVQVVGVDSDMPDGDLFEVDFEYVPQASRNNAAAGITNRVDIWTGGQRSQGAVQSVVFKSGNYFTDTALPTNDPLSRHKFVRLDGTRPAVGNIFIPLAWGPILTVPNTLSISGQVFAMACKGHNLGTSEVIAEETIKYAYHLVQQDDAFGYTTTSKFGLEWYNNGLYKPTNLAAFSVGAESNAAPYLYNRMVHDIQDQVEKWRLLGVDARVHQAKVYQLRMSLAVMYEPRVNPPAVDTLIDTALADYMTTRGFQGRVQVSDLLQVAHNVPGVDNIRFLHGGDYPTYNPATPNNFAIGIQQIIEDVVVKSYVDTSGRAIDIRLGDNELPAYYGHVIKVKAENTFGSG